jgi:hypothetical protein
LLHPVYILQYQLAILELDDEKIPDRLATARAAIKERQQQECGFAERAQLEEMLRALKVLEVKRKSSNRETRTKSEGELSE